jgi:phage tail protein X
MRVKAIAGERIESVIVRAIGDLKPGYVEATLKANPHLLDFVEIFEGGEEVFIPDLSPLVTPVRKVKSLWDLA